MITEKTIRVIGITTTIVGAGTALLADWIGEKKMDLTIEKKVAEALAKMVEKA